MLGLAELSGELAAAQTPSSAAGCRRLRLAQHQAQGGQPPGAGNLHSLLCSSPSYPATSFSPPHSAQRPWMECLRQSRHCGQSPAPNLSWSRSRPQSEGRADPCESRTRLARQIHRVHDMRMIRSAPRTLIWPRSMARSSGARASLDAHIHVIANACRRLRARASSSSVVGIMTRISGDENPRKVWS
jgi:hypothetical protein